MLEVTKTDMTKTLVFQREGADQNRTGARDVTVSYQPNRHEEASA